MEKWKQVLGYEGFYEVSDMGNVKSFYNKKEKILSPRFSIHGYLCVILCKDGIKKNHTVHRLVWEAFNGKTDLHIDHILENNKADNRLCNLQVLTKRENTSKYYSISKTSSKYTGVSWDKANNKWKAHIYIDGKLKHLGRFVNELDAANAYQLELKKLK